MRERPLVSVLMGIYNCASTLEEAVDCIIHQTYENWELIMCDDCSSDNTYETALRIAQKDSRIRVLKNEKNLTLAPTLNHCLREAKGEYTARMDGDDICPADRFQKEVDFLNENPQYAVVSGSMEMYDEDGVFRVIRYTPDPAPQDFLNRSPFCHAACMMRRQVLEDLGGYDTSEKVNRVEDYDLWIRLYEKGYKGHNLPDVLYSMRDDRNAFSRRKFKYRINESRLKLRVCKNNKLSFLSRISAVKPILVGLLPPFVYKKLHTSAKS